MQNYEGEQQPEEGTNWGRPNVWLDKNFNCIEAEQLSTYRAAAAVDAGHHHDDLSVLLTLIHRTVPEGGVAGTFL